MTSSQATYMLSDRDKQEQESKRLNIQHEQIMHVFRGQLLHPSISPIQEHSAIADIGTGTGLWLNAVARSFPSKELRLIGFDITSDKFSKENERGVELVVHDITKTFDTKWHGMFDIVHLRLLVYAIREADVGKVVENIRNLLKPGGYLQWQETDVNDIWAKPTSPVISRAIEAVNLERQARQLSLFMPSTLLHSLIAPSLSLPSSTTTPLLLNSPDIFRILHLETIRTDQITLPPDLEMADQDAVLEVLFILLKARILRREREKEKGTEVGGVKEGEGETKKEEEIEKELQKVREEGKIRVRTKFTWVVAQKTGFVDDAGRERD